MLHLIIHSTANISIWWFSFFISSSFSSFLHCVDSFDLYMIRILCESVFPIRMGFMRKHLKCIRLAVSRLQVIFYNWWEKNRGKNNIDSCLEAKCLLRICIRACIGLGIDRLFYFFLYFTRVRVMQWWYHSTSNVCQTVTFITNISILFISYDFMFEIYTKFAWRKKNSPKKQPIEMDLIIVMRWFFLWNRCWRLKPVWNC